MSIKFIILFAFFIIVYSLGSALYYLLKDPSGSHRLIKALTVRVSLSILLLIFLIISFKIGWLSPHGIGAID